MDTPINRIASELVDNVTNDIYLSSYSKAILWSKIIENHINHPNMEEYELQIDEYTLKINTKEVKIEVA